MKKIDFLTTLSNGGREFFVSPIEEKLYAYKLTKEQAIQFSQRFDNIDQVSKEYGEENLLTMGEQYEGFILMFLGPCVLRLGWMSGTIEYLDPSKIQILSSAEFRNKSGYFAKKTLLTDDKNHKRALEEKALFHINGEFKECLVIPREMKIAEALYLKRWAGDPEGDPEKIEKELQEKLVKGFIDGEIDLTKAEDYCLHEHFCLEYRHMFKD